MRRTQMQKIDQAVERLEKKHEELKMAVAELDSRRGLTAQEQLQRAELKKAKLRAKDEMSRLRAVHP